MVTDSARLVVTPMRLLSTDLLADSTLPPVRKSALGSVVKYRSGYHAIFSIEHRNLGFLSNALAIKIGLSRMHVLQ